MALKRQFYEGIEAGTDEAGRGCLAGPVTAATVILPPDFTSELLTDSKKLSEKKRLQLKDEIEKQALSYAVSHVFPEEIDQINILNASIKAMHLSIKALTILPEHILVDGNRFHPYKNIPHRCEIKGDSRFLNIAAASILAKTYRDAYMLACHKEFSDYHWNQNKGYPTKTHRRVLAQIGPCRYHRKSFRLLPDQLHLQL